MPIYANLIKTYNGKRTLWESAKELREATVITDLAYGGDRGYYGRSPIDEVPSECGKVVPGVAALCNQVERNIENPTEVIGDLIISSIEDAWRPDAFHVVLHSSGWDSRMMSGAIKRLVKKHGEEWLGNGLLFLSNRWEAHRFVPMMKAMEWREDQYAVYDDWRVPDEHFAYITYDVWRCAPYPRPANFLWYLPEWAIAHGLIPTENVQTFTGLWTNEVWQCFCDDPSRWPTLASNKYGWHMIASMPILSQFVEYPLVTLRILDALRRSNLNGMNGNELRRAVAKHLNPDVLNVKPCVYISDGYHPISERLRNELDDYYRSTDFGKIVKWTPPEHSGNSNDWGRWSVALLVDRMIKNGTRITYTDRRGRPPKQVVY